MFQMLKNISAFCGNLQVSVSPAVYSVLIRLPSSLSPGLQSGLFLSRNRAKVLYIHPSTLLRRVTRIDFITILILSSGYKLYSSSCCGFIQLHVVISPVSYVQTLFTALSFSFTSSLCSSLIRTYENVCEYDANSRNISGTFLHNYKSLLGSGFCNGF
jgi:hypothetical protein